MNQNPINRNSGIKTSSTTEYTRRIVKIVTG
jgi:hypothetical protein